MSTLGLSIGIYMQNFFLFLYTGEVYKVDLVKVTPSLSPYASR